MRYLLPEQRKLQSLKMLEQKKEKQQLPTAEYKGDLTIGEFKIPCAVLDDGRRILKEYGINSLLGSAGGKQYVLRDNTKESETVPLPLFLASKPLKPFIIKAFGNMDLSPIEFKDGKKISTGYDANILPKVCEVWLEAREDGVLQESQLPKAQKAEILMRSLAYVGIVALVDEATGYQQEREKNALAKILEAFVAKELQPYLTTFPAEYYENLFRLYGIEYPLKDKKTQWRPAFFGSITNKVVYERLAPEVLPELKKSAAKAKKSSRLHQWLTSDTGHPKLRELLASIVTLLKLSKTKEEFFELVDKIHPKFPK